MAQMSPNAGKILAAIAVVWLTTTPMATAAGAASTWSLLPQPANVRLAPSGVAKIADGALVAVRGADSQKVQPIADRFMQLVADTRGLQLHPATTADVHPAITFDVDPHASLVGESGYRIIVGADGIRVIALAGRRVLWGCHAVAIVDAAGLGPRHRGRDCRGRHRRSPAFRMARAATRFRTAFSEPGRHREIDRLDVAREAQRVALAPDRGPRLAARDTQVPRTHENRCMPQGGGTRHRTDRRS